MRAVLLLLLLAGPASASTKTLTLEEFLLRTARADTEFEEILTEQLALQYRKELGLPANEWILSVKEDLSLYTRRDEKDVKSTVGLSRLFRSGTNISADYTRTPTAGSLAASSDVSFTLSQSIARNAFGRSTRKLDRILGKETDIARHQIIEAYEDFFAVVYVFYLDWYGAYENLLVGRASHQENLKLLDNIKARRKSRIAKRIDENKISIQVLAKKETLILLEEKHASALNLVKRAIRYTGTEILVPVLPRVPEVPDSFEQGYAEFAREGRTYKVLKMLEEVSGLKTAREADALLPSLDLSASILRAGTGSGFAAPDDTVGVGLSLSFPFQGKEALETAKIGQEKTRRASQNARFRLNTDMRNLHLGIEREKKLKGVADEKIEMAESILKDETENYTFARVTLNDYIVAVNRLDSNRFNQIARAVRWRKLRVEWLRISDSLVTEDSVRKRHSK